MNSRRSFIKKVGVAAGAASLAVSTNVLAEAQKKKKAKRALRIAHLTDVHLLAEPKAENAMVTLFTELNSMKDQPDFIINTGDTIMDANNQLPEVVEERWEAWHRVCQHNSLKMHHCIGNHDVWYLPKEKKEQYKGDKRLGKTWVMDELKMKQRYYSFSQGGWHFIGLDSINYGDKGVHIDEEQLTWLKAELDKIGPDAPVCVYSHIPILSITSFTYYLHRKPATEVRFPWGDMHSDFNDLKALFHKHKNVKLALSGHNHYIDDVDYLGTKYLCNGAVSGSWWGGDLDEFPPAYALIDLYEDGTIEHEMVYYKWK
ncbi:metallophosphoesterase [Rapidithrix thailandica]|uniref:Metallophosphoesterase n=1 Tax=Rapidithrix thailandica TaxID=413964 RepID=A0AAW9SBM6_9BACT